MGTMTKQPEPSLDPRLRVVCSRLIERYQKDFGEKNLELTGTRSQDQKLFQVNSEAELFPQGSAEAADVYALSPTPAAGSLWR
ncbi:hypothetical protein BGZ83_011335 [Gryganskiella cystojenkinii]|nr:hypothetical protein BGZ83_011335 [Gryganskiella cystojenkinii]